MLMHMLIESEILEAETAAATPDSAVQQQSTWKERTSDDIKQLSTGYVKGYLRIRFCIPRTFPDIEVLPQGIVVPIPDCGEMKNHKEFSAYFCFTDTGAIEWALWQRESIEAEWEKPQYTQQIFTTQDIPAILDRCLHLVNWNALGRVDHLRFTEKEEDDQNGRSSTLMSDA